MDSAVAASPGSSSERDGPQLVRSVHQLPGFGKMSPSAHTRAWPVARGPTSISLADPATSQGSQALIRTTVAGLP